jgi:pyruvate/2-oxoglutarate dehydrogenase complex dihydrolipoamide dehydrogenase (E3) component
MKLSIAVVESDKVGGTCVNWGCTPTKTLVASARAAHVARRGADYGVETGDVRVDFEKVMERVNNMRVPASAGFEGWLKQTTAFYRGEASFVDDHTVRVRDDTIRGEKVIVHTGTRSRKPDFKGVDEVPWLDNKGILTLKTLPEHLLVVGGSYIGLEFAQAFRRLGSKVSVIEHGERIVSREDPDISALAQVVLEAEGIEFYLKSEVQLLETAGVETTKRGYISVNDMGQTSIPHIYALGDVNGRGAFTHTSVHDGQVFLEHLTGGKRKISDRIPIHSIFIDPPMARVGMSEIEARQSGKTVLMAARAMGEINRAKEKDEIIGMIALAMQANLPFTKLQETVIPHPTVSELIPWIFSDLKPLKP